MTDKIYEGMFDDVPSIHENMFDDVPVLDKEEPNLALNAGKLAINRGADLVGSAVSGVGKVITKGSELLADGVNSVAGTDIKPAPIGGFLSDVVAPGISDFDAGYQEHYSMKKLVEDPNVENVMGMIAEKGVASIPDMYLAFKHLPAYIGIRTEEIALERAQQDGREKPGANDYLISFQTAVATSLMERIAPQSAFAKKPVTEGVGAGVKQFGKEVVKTAGKEAGTEFVQENLEYVATNAGTKTGWDAEEALMRGGEGAIVGGGVGGGTSAAGQAYNHFADKESSQTNNSPNPDQSSPVSDNENPIAPAGVGAGFEAEQFAEESPKAEPAVDAQIDSVDLINQDVAVNHNELDPQMLKINEPENAGVVEQSLQEQSIPIEQDQTIPEVQEPFVSSIPEIESGPIINEAPIQEPITQEEIQQPTIEEQPVQTLESIMEEAYGINSGATELATEQFVTQKISTEEFQQALQGIAQSSPNNNEIAFDEQTSDVKSALKQKNTQVRTKRNTEVVLNTAENLNAKIKNRTKKVIKKIKQSEQSKAFDKGLEKRFEQQQLKAEQANQEVLRQEYEKTQLAREFRLAEEHNLDREFSAVHKAVQKSLKPGNDIDVDAFMTSYIEDEVKAVEIESQVHEAATSPNNDRKEPTQAQKEAGNYKKSHIKHSGFDIAIENPKGSIRQGTDENGKAWSVEMKSHYGDIKRTNGADNDPIDVFVNPETSDSNHVFIVNQVNPSTGKFDEHKVMLGYDGTAAARLGYFANYDKSWRNSEHEFIRTTKDEFNAWLKDGDTTKPYQKVNNITEKENTLPDELSVQPKKLTEEEVKGKSEVKTDDDIQKNNNEKITDIGDKIGGARKDTSEKLTEKKSDSKPKSKLKHSYHKDYKVVEIAKDMKWPELEGKFSLQESRKGGLIKDRSRGISFDMKPLSFDTQEEAENAALLAAVSKKHRVDYEYKRDSNGKLERDNKGNAVVEKYRIVRRVSDRKKVVIKDNFKTEYDAKVYMAKNALEIYEKKTNFGEEIIVTTDNPNRSGKKWRDKDVEPEQFKEQFGFRGVEFGNWNNQEERQEVMNFAFDGLMDLSELLNIPPKALSLRGQLALAFGARGKGLSGAKAHYEMDYGVINLTKMSGSGSLAHEWLHAFDHYLGRLASNAEMEMTAKDKDGNPIFDVGRDPVSDFLSAGVGRKPTIRPELLSAWRDVKDAAFTNIEESEEIHAEHVARQENFLNGYKKRMDDELDSFVKNLESDITSNYRKRNAKPANSEQLAKVKKIIKGLRKDIKTLSFATLPMQELTGRSSWSHRTSNEQIDTLAKIYKKVRGKYGFDTKDRRGVMDNIVNAIRLYQSQLNKLDELTNKKTGQKITATRFLMDARDIDQGRVKDYWSTNHEMMARSFSSYIEDKVRDSGDKSEFLSYGSDNELPQYKLFNVKPFPEGKERAKINDAFDQLFKEIKTKETDKGVEFFRYESGEKTTEAPAGISLEQAQKVADEFQASYNGNIPLTFRVEETQELLHGPEATFENVGVIKGGYYPQSRVLTLAAKSQTSLEDAKSTLRHEILGHFGLNTFKPKDKKRILQRIIESKNHKDLKQTWLSVEKNYSHLSEERQAEEVFASFAESKPADVSFWQSIINTVRSAVRDVGLSLGNINKAEIESIILDISQSIKSGKAKQQTFPQSDLAQFRKGTPESPSFTVNEDEGRLNQFIRRVQDKFKPLKTTQEAITKSGKIISDEENAYVAEELFHGKTEEDLRKMERDLIQPLVKEMTANDIDMGELDLFLIAKHAKERNAHIASINDDFPDGGSGMLNAEADEILKRLATEGKIKALESVASTIYQMTNKRQEELVSSGLLDDRTITSWNDSYEYYVPLKGYAEGELNDSGKSIPRVGKGFAISGKETMQALGRRTMAASPATQVIQDLTETIIRKRKNEVGNTFLKLVEENPNPEYWEIFTDENPDVDKRFDKSSGKVVETKKPMAMMADQYFTTKKKGKTYYIKIEDPRLMDTMKNIGVEKVNGVVQVLGVINRVLSSINTSLNPEFVVSNMARDIQTAIYNVMAEQALPTGKIKDKKIALNMVKDWAAARKGIALSLGNKPIAKGKAGEYQKLYDQFREDGAKTGYFDMKDVDQQVQDINSMLEMAGNSKKGKILRAKKKLGDLIEHVNQSVENAVRLSAYKQALGAGISQQKAASLAKNLTVNFNRKGEIGTTLNAFYMFANASIQGTAQFLRSMQGYKDSEGNYKFTGAQKAAGVMVAGAFALAAVNRMFSDDDDDGVSFWDKVPSHVKERNLVIMKSVFGGDPQKYWSIPLPYGYNVFSVAGTVGEGVLEGSIEPMKAATTIAGALLGSFSPIGAQDSDDIEKGAIKTLAPTILQPMAQLAVNESFTGNPIYRENHAFGTPSPDSSLSKRSTQEHWKALSSFLNQATGGSDYRSGFIDVNPETFAHLFDFATGAAGSFVARTNNAITKAAKGEELKDREIPFYRKLNGEIQDDYQDQSMFYDRLDEIKQLKKESSSLRGKERFDFNRKYHSQLSLLNKSKSIEKRLKVYRKQLRRIEDRADYKGKNKAIDNVKARQDKLIDGFNKLYNAIEN